MIDAHNRLSVRHHDLIERQSDLEKSLPGVKRRSSFIIGNETIAEGDDPQWIALKHDYMAYQRDLEAVENAIHLARATTIAGAVVLLRHIANDKTDFFDRNYEYEDNNGKPLSITACFLGEMADALERIAANGAVS